MRNKSRLEKPRTLPIYSRWDFNSRSYIKGLKEDIGKSSLAYQRGQNQTGEGVPGIPNNNSLDLLMNMFGGLGGGGLGSFGGAPNPSNVPPEELYATQLSQLQEMGFFDTQENIRALTATAGNVHAAVERLLGNLGQ